MVKSHVPGRVPRNDAAEVKFYLDIIHKHWRPSNGQMLYSNVCRAYVLFLTVASIMERKSSTDGMWQAVELPLQVGNAGL